MGLAHYDIIVVGAGHAGIEAALASARSGCSTLMLTINLDNVGQMSCNPAIGGIGKGHLVRELDALGGEMGRAIDACGIQFRRLNTRKGPAVQASRAQADKSRYRLRMKQVVESTPGLTLLQSEVTDLVVEAGRVLGVVTDQGERIEACAVILTTGTFLESVMHVGERKVSGGRAGDRAARGLSAALSRLGLETGRLKTGTCPRLDGRSIDYRRLEEQPGDAEPCWFSFEDSRQPLPQVSCWITHTTRITHRIIRENIDKSAIYNGSIDSRGPRYCPSIEDKVVKFPDRSEHRIFLEPEGLDTVEIYPNGLSTSLPYAVQKQFVASIPGLEKAVIVRPGYAIEYDYVIPTQLSASLAVIGIQGLFLAGQINGSTGYEEAAAQGFVAGVNAVRLLRGAAEFVLGREEAYIGVLIDDLVTRGVDGEPYRMFTSRAEYRLLLREDNADLRLAERANALGLISPERRAAVATKGKLMAAGLEQLVATRVTPQRSVNEQLAQYGESSLASPATAFELLKRPGLDYAEVAAVAQLQRYPAAVEEQLEIAASYHGYVERQHREVARMRSLEGTPLPGDLDYETVSGLSREACEKLRRVRPTSLGQVSRISGLTPAALSALAVHLRKLGRT